MRHATIVGKTVINLSQKFNLGSGSTWPGHLALKADPKFIRKAIAKNPELKVIIIAGTNGKTTTTKALQNVLKDSGISTIANDAGANLLNGLATLVAKHITLNGNLKHKALIFECDENTLPKALEEIPNPSCVVLLNLFRDQLDRYGEVNSIAEKWTASLKKLNESTVIVANADDPLVAHCALSIKKSIFFSVPNELKTERSLAHAVDSTTCPVCRGSLEYLNISYSHLGNYICPNCSFKNPRSESLRIPTNLLGAYNQYNLNAVFQVAKSVFKIKDQDILKSLESFTPAFGRQEKLSVNGKNIMLLLSKNPTGFNESLKVASENRSKTLLILLNDRIPDGRDISWIWDVDFELLRYKKIKVIVSGDRAYDMSNRLLFAGITHEVFDDFEKGYGEALNLTPDNAQLTILPTYSAMLEIRKLVSGKSIL